MCIPKIGNGLRVWHSIWLAGKAPLACSYQHSNLPGPTRLSCVKANSIHGPLLQGLHLHWRLLSTYTPIEEIPALIRTTLATSLVPYPPIAALCIVAYTPFARTKPRKLIVLDALESRNSCQTQERIDNTGFERTRIRSTSAEAKRRRDWPRDYLWLKYNDAVCKVKE